MNNKMRKFTAVLLAFVMFLSCMPMNALAALVPTNQVNASGGVTLRNVVVTDACDTYVFHNGDAIVRQQKVVAGDYLYAPGTPEAPSGNNKFLGWAIDADSSRMIAFDANGRYTVSSASGATVDVYALFADYVYATFYDQDGVIYSRIGVAKNETVDSLSYTPKTPYQNMAGWSTVKNSGDNTGAATGKVTFPYTMETDQSFYPIIETGYWIHFDANRSHVAGMDEVNVSYTAPLFVHEGDTTAKPADPVADIAAYKFEKWYTDADCTTPFTWGSTISENTVLYANWTVEPVQYSVVVWQQKVTDDKNATGDAREWDYVTSYTATAAIGTTVSYDQQSGATRVPETIRNNTKENQYEGFTRDHYDASIVVKADGSSTLNVYYRRNLMTINFYVYRSNNNWNYTEAAYSTRQNSPRSNAALWRTITGLYGATFAQSVSTNDTASDYVWPAQYKWYTPDDGAYTQSLLSAFTTEVTPLRFYCMGNNGSNMIYHVKQKADGSWPTSAQVTADNSTYADIAKLDGWGAGFTISNKYNTFHAVAYSNGTYYQTGAGRTSATPGRTTITSGSWPLYVYHERNSYTIEFFNGTAKVDSGSELYEASLSGYSSKELTPADEARYTFGGWSFTPDDHDANHAIDWSTETMPARTVRVYAIWVSIAYNVKLDLGADDAVMNEAQSKNFWPTYGATINDSYMMAATRPGYSLVGWYDANGNAWDFGNAVTKDLCDEGPLYDAQYKNNYYILHLTAKWRISATVKASYNFGEYAENVTNAAAFTDDNTYVHQGSFSVVTTQPELTGDAANTIQFIGWKDLKGNLHNPGDSFVIDDEALLEAHPTEVDSQGNPIMYLKLTAVYDSGVPTSTITYHATYNNDSYLDETKRTWNSSVTMPGDTFTRNGYVLVGWNAEESAAAAGTIQFAVGSDVLVSAMNTWNNEGDYNEDTYVGNNHLYAVWAIEVKAVVEGTTKTETYDGKAHTNDEYTVKYYVGGVEAALPDGITATVSAVPAEGTNVGTYTGSVAVTLSGEATGYAIAEANVSAEIKLIIEKRAVTFTGETDTRTYTGSEIELTGVTVGGDGLADDHTHNVTYSAKGTNVGEYPGTITPDSDVKIMSGNVDVTANYDITVVSGKLTITPDETEVTVTITGNHDSKVYTASEQSVTGYTTDVGEKTINVALKTEGKDTAKGTNVGHYDMGLTKDDFTVTSDNYSNIKVEVVDGYLDITPITDEYEITVTGNSDTKVYNTSEQSVNGYTVSTYDSTITFTGLAQDDAKATAKGTNVGTYTMAMTKDDFTATSANYTNIKITVVPGKLTITPITDEYEITVTGNSDTKVYNGTEQSVNGYTVSAYDSTINFTGLAQDDAKATAKGTNVGDYTMTMAVDDFGATSTNYTNIKITVVPGKLTITPITDKVTVKITENSGSEKYDGVEKTVTGYTVTSISNTLYTEADFTFSGNDTVKGTDAGSYPMELKAADFTNISDNFTNVEFVIVDGTLEISKRTVTMTSADGEKTYDGTPLTKNAQTDVTVGGDGFVTGEGATYDITGTQTLVGNSKNTFTYTLNEGTKAGNYDITQIEGTLTVTDDNVDPEHVVKKTVDNKEYALGATVTFNIEVTNIYDHPVTILLSEIEGVELAQSKFEDVEAGKTVNTTATYTITEADILAGGFTNTVTATVQDLDKTAEATAAVEAPNGHLTIEKETTSEPENGATYALGETITYKVTVINDGNLTITDITVTDELTGDEWTIDSLAPGASKDFQAEYVVTEEDILAGKVVNEATGTGTSPDPDNPDVPVDPGDTEDDTDEPNGHLTIEKETTI